MQTFECKGEFLVLKIVFYMLIPQKSQRPQYMYLFRFKIKILCTQDSRQSFAC